jgi:FG-GAP-like repeat
MRSILRKAWLIGLACTAGFSGCADLSEMEEGYCGNGVAEPDYGEDCDNFSDETCIGPGEKNECRLDCSPGDEDVRPACPTGWGCGTDDLCRQPDGTFEEQGWVSLEDAPKLGVADVDGDRRADLVSVTTQELIVSFFDNEGNVAKSVHRYSFPTAPAVGQLTSEESPEDVVLLADGMTVLPGGKDRALQPTAYAPFSVHEPSAKAVVMEAMPMGLEANDPSKWVGDEIIVLAGGKARYIGRWSQSDLMTMDQPTATFAGDPLVGSLNPAWQCDDLILNFEGAEALIRYNTCQYNALDVVGWNHDDAAIAVHVPSGQQIATPALLVDVNLDERLDLVVGVVEPGTDTEEFVDEALPVIAYGVGDGTFNSTPPPPLPEPNPQDPPDPLEPGDGYADWLTLPNTPGLDRSEEPQMPLAIGDVNNDGIADYVMRDAVLVSILGPSSSGNLSYGALAANEGYLWDQAVIEDFNANGFPDVIVGSINEHGITFYNGTGIGLFNKFWLPTRGYPAHFTVGDFDGDLVKDLAFAETNVETVDGSEPGDALSVVFGQGFGGPSDPVTMGYLGNIEQIAAGSMAAFHLDDIDDLLVISRPDDNPASNVSIASLGGSSDRQLLSPFILSQELPGLPPIEMTPWLVTVGEFDGDTTHADLAAMGIKATELTGPDALLKADMRLWLVPSTGEAAIDSDLDRPSERLPLGVLGTQAAMAALDLTGDGIDEVVILAPGVEMDAQSLYGQVFVARAGSVDDGTAFTLEEAGRTPEVYWQALGGLPLEVVLAGMAGDPDAVDTFGDHIGTHIAVGDVDGDDQEDIVTLAFAVDLATGSVSSEIQLIRPDGQGGLDMGGIINLTRDVVEGPNALTLVNLDDDKALELVFVTEDAAYRADIEDGSLVNVTLLEDVEGGYSVAAADFTGDGVVDVAVGQDGGVILYKGNAVNP